VDDILTAGTATHVLSWTAPQGAWSGGTWAIQPAGDWADGQPQRSAGIWLLAPADLPVTSLAAWAADRLGWPVALERACAFEEPVFYVAPAADFCSGYYAELELAEAMS
jgi:hypothetical protein